jgi:uncharacterized membrane protein YeaQ/YmgE (transglycosylase-associated protein family)
MPIGKLLRQNPAKAGWPYFGAKRVARKASAKNKALAALQIDVLACATSLAPVERKHPLPITRRMYGRAPMGILSWLILGLIGGFVGSKIINGRGEGLLMDIVLGLIGAVVGGFIFASFGSTGITGLNIGSMIVAIIGSVIVIYLYHNVLNVRR